MIMAGYHLIVKRKLMNYNKLKNKFDEENKKQIEELNAQLTVVEEEIKKKFEKENSKQIEKINNQMQIIKQEIKKAISMSEEYGVPLIFNHHLIDYYNSSYYVPNSFLDRVDFSKLDSFTQNEEEIFSI